MLRLTTAATLIKPIRQASLLAFVYCTADIALNTVLGGGGGAVFWPLNGLTAALLLIQPRRRWVGIITIVGISTMLGEYLSGSDRILFLVGLLSYVPEVLLPALLLPAFTNLESWLGAPRLYVRFTVAVLLGPLFAATVYSTGYRVFGAVPFLTTFLDFAPSETIGVATMIPLVLATVSVTRSSLRQPLWWLRVSAVLGVTAGTMMLMFGTGRYPLLFLLYPLLIWAEYLLGLLGSSLALCCACIFAAWLTDAGHGPFVQALPSPHTAVQLYLAFHWISFLPVSILMTERHFLMRELRVALAQATTLASVDGLTGLANRRTFDSRIRELWQFALRHQVPLALLMIDVDHFKSFNDQLGHQAGDDCLRRLAGALKDSARRPSDIAARYGGEEFAILLLDVPPQQAYTFAEEIRAAVFALSTPHPGAPGTGCVTVSVGCVSLLPQRDMLVDELIARADKALYLAKHEGRNRVCCERAGGESGPARPALRRLHDRVRAFAARSSTTCNPE